MGIFKRKRHQAKTGLVEDVDDTGRLRPDDADQLEEAGDAAAESLDVEESARDQEFAQVREPEQDQDQAPGQVQEPEQVRELDQGPEPAAQAEDSEPDAQVEEYEPDEPAFDRADGPFDASEVQQDGSRLDLGALQLPAVPGMQVNLEVDEAAQTVNAVQVGLGGSHVQLQAFAAPRSSGVWAEVRTEIAQSITAQGGSAEIIEGPLGREIAARMPGNGPAVRFFGVDGPRWFLRAVVSGPAATDEGAAGRLMEAVKGTVVVRGADAMAPRELLPLRMPPSQQPPDPAPDQEPGQEPGQEPTQAGQDRSGAPAERSGDDLKPFERGPEITEVR